jgi:hypothetical protein
MLTSPEPNVNCYQRGGCTFKWSWDRSPLSDEYFQVQMIGPNGERRGIHPPTKEYLLRSDESMYHTFVDWCDVKYYCHSHWTVAVIEWDGQDPSRIGQTLIEAPKREIVF